MVSEHSNFAKRTGNLKKVGGRGVVVVLSTSVEFLFNRCAVQHLADNSEIVKYTE